MSCPRFGKTEDVFKTGRVEAAVGNGASRFSGGSLSTRKSWSDAMQEAFRPRASNGPAAKALLYQVGEIARYLKQPRAVPTSGR